MLKINEIKKVLLSIVLLCSSTLIAPVFALDIESLVEFSEGKESIIYKLTNNKAHDLFISTKVFQLVADNEGQVDQIEYNSENVDSWEVSLSESKFILRFMPTKIIEGNNQLGINYGYGIASVFETKTEAESQPESNVVGNRLLINNNSNKFLSVQYCESTVDLVDCPVSSYLIPSRNKAITLDKSMQNKNIKVFLKSNDGKIYYEKIHHINI